jgi:hypothetical protein
MIRWRQGAGGGVGRGWCGRFRCQQGVASRRGDLGARRQYGADSAVGTEPVGDDNLRKWFSKGIAEYLAGVFRIGDVPAGKV